MYACVVLGLGMDPAVESLHPGRRWLKQIVKYIVKHITKHIMKYIVKLLFDVHPGSWSKRPGSNLGSSLSSTGS